MKSIPKPEEGEYNPYTIMYIGLLPDDGMVLNHLLHNLNVVRKMVGNLTDEQLSTPHRDGEWTIKEILVHIVDDERIYTYRALRFARNDKTELPGFEQDDYVRFSGANERSIEDILEEYAHVRHSTIALFSYLPQDAFTRSGIANGHVMSVRAAAYHIAGHELHHLISIRENYLTQ